MANFFVGFVFSTLGIYVLREGRKQENPTKMGLGVALFLYPYFVQSALISFILGAALFGVSFFV